MNKARKKFVWYAMIAVCVLVGALLGILNGINFTMVAQDADRVTQMIAGDKGTLTPDSAADRLAGDVQRLGNGPGGTGPMGPDSPEMPYSIRYFTVRFDGKEDREGTLVAYHISAFTEEEARALALSLRRESTGWTGTVYRYRVYKGADGTFVTVVDQSRELQPSYRILFISVVGLVAVLGVCLAFLLYISRRLFRPLEEVDRKQKLFMTEAEKEFQVPLTVIHADTELLEKQYGSSQATQSIHRQVRKMAALTRRIGAMGLFENGEAEREMCDLSHLVDQAADTCAAALSRRGVDLQRTVGSGIFVSGSEEALRRMAEELLENVRKFAVSRAAVSLSTIEGRVVLVVTNDTTLPDGSVEQIFDRFTRLENAEGTEGNGLGLASVKEIVKAHNGRLNAWVQQGMITLRVTL